jgi:drug/metabolite transporter (DMT)-like permease
MFLVDLKEESVAERKRPAGKGLYLLVVFTLFLIWSNSFLAIDALLAQPGTSGPFQWQDLVVARFLPVMLICLGYCLGFRFHESLALLRRHGLRLLIMGLLSVEGYNCFLYYGQQHGIAPAIAALTISLNPLFMMALGSIILGERLTTTKWLGFFISLGGLVLVCLGKGGGGVTYPLLVAVTALAPLSWVFYSILGKPIHEEGSPLLATFLSLILGSLPLFPWLSPALLNKAWTMTLGQWELLGFLSIPCTVVRFALWNWLLKHLSASTVGFTMFLNPPLATLFNFIFLGSIPTLLQILGGAVLLAGIFLAIWEIEGNRTGQKEPRNNGLKTPVSTQAAL